MSPEQAKGRVVDKRTDIWAFGCVFYEMLTARRAFDGEDVTDTIAAIVRGEPDWNALPADTPPQIRLLLKRCLEKDRRARIADIGVARFVIDEWRAQEVGSPRGAEAAPSRHDEDRWRGGPGYRCRCRYRRGHSLVDGDSGAARSTRTIQGHASGAKFAGHSRQRSRRGRCAGRVLCRLSRRRYDEGAGAPGEARHRRSQRTPARRHRVPCNPIISPDGRWVAFGTQGELRKVAVAGGAPITICKILGSTRCQLGFRRPHLVLDLGRRPHHAGFRLGRDPGPVDLAGPSQWQHHPYLPEGTAGKSECAIHELDGQF